MVTVFDKKVMPHIAEADQTPAVRLLMAFIEQQQETIQQQQSEIEALKAELARLKKLVALSIGDLRECPPDYISMRQSRCSSKPV